MCLPLIVSDMSCRSLQIVLLAWGARLDVVFAISMFRDLVVMQKLAQSNQTLQASLCVEPNMHKTHLDNQDFCAGVHASGPLCSFVLAGVTLDPCPSGRVPVCGNFPDLHEPAIPRLGAHEEV